MKIWEDAKIGALVDDIAPSCRYGDVYDTLTAVSAIQYVQSTPLTPVYENIDASAIVNTLRPSTR